jgi:hypothetical protein
VEIATLLPDLANTPPQLEKDFNLREKQINFGNAIFNCLINLAWIFSRKGYFLCATGANQISRNQNLCSCGFLLKSYKFEFNLKNHGTETKQE